jgi:hypothetical protein
VLEKGLENKLGNKFNISLLNIPFSLWLNLYDTLRSAVQDSVTIALRYSVQNII